MHDKQDAIREAATVVMIGLDAAAEGRLAQELAALLRWLEPLPAVDPAGTEPLLFSHEAVNVLRPDEPLTEETDRIEHSGSHFRGGFYRVPVILE